MFCKPSLKMLIILLVSLVFFTPVQAGFFDWFSSPEEKPVRKAEVDFDWLFNQEVNLIRANSDQMSLKLYNGFSITAAYGNKIYIGAKLSSFASSSNFNNPGFGSISRTRFGVPIYIVTPWMKFFYRESTACRAKFGFLLDVTGLGVKAPSQNDTEISGGRLREHLAFCGFEVSPLVVRGSAFFIRASYTRSIFGYKSDGEYNFHSGGDDNFYFGIGASIKM